VKAYEPQAEMLLSALAEPGGRIGIYCVIYILLLPLPLLLIYLYFVVARDHYKLLLGYIVSFFYVANVVARPMAMAELTLHDFADLQVSFYFISIQLSYLYYLIKISYLLSQLDGVCLMANFKTCLTYTVQAVGASSGTVE